MEGKGGVSREILGRKERGREGKEAKDGERVWRI